VLDAIFSRGLVGLDIGSMMIKAVQFKGKGDKRQLAAAAVTELSQEVIEGMEEDMRDTLIAETIKKLFKDNNISSKNVITSLSGDDVIVRPVKLPYIPLEELPDVIAYEAENYIPLAIDQVVLDYEVLGEVEEGEGQKKRVKRRRQHHAGVSFFSNEIRDVSRRRWPLA
jgi:type IV pilus assembly protein PilM